MNASFFKQAGHLLDASARIYSFRVDVTHTAAYEVRSQLGEGIFFSLTADAVSLIPRKRRFLYAEIQYFFFQIERLVRLLLMVSFYLEFRLMVIVN